VVYPACPDEMAGIVVARGSGHGGYTTIELSR